MQRLRDQVRDWVDSGQKHLDIDMLLEARRDVEVEMVSFETQAEMVSLEVCSSRLNRTCSALASPGISRVAEALICSGRLSMF